MNFSFELTMEWCEWAKFSISFSFLHVIPLQCYGCLKRNAIAIFVYVFKTLWSNHRTIRLWIRTFIAIRRRSFNFWCVFFFVSSIFGANKFCSRWFDVSNENLWCVQSCNWKSVLWVGVSVHWKWDGFACVIIAICLTFHLDCRILVYHVH